ncbi:MAG TPA: MFS transporter [Bryobacteraceae bacterium]|nr:MFS transporter [Bryobacteraceae bacterium]
MAPSTAANPTALQRLFKAFHYRDFRLMFVGACVSSIGTWMQILAQAWLVLTITQSPFYLGLDAFLAGLPVFLLSILGGVVADRVERRRVLLVSQYIQMASSGILTLLLILHVVWVPTAAHQHGGGIWYILCLSFISGTAQSFGGPAYSALIPTLVRKEDMPNAIALNSIQFNLARVLGPAIGGVVFDRMGATWCFGLNSLSFLAPVISLTILATRYLPEKTGESVWTSMKQGFRFIRHQGAIESLIFLAFSMTALGFPMMTFLPWFAKSVFRGGPWTFTLFLCSSGIGAVLGSLGVAWLGNVGHKGRIALASLVWLGVGITLFALSPSVAFSCVVLFLTGAGMMTVFANVVSLVQIITPNEMRGRVMSIYNSAFRGGMPMGNLVTGWLVPIFTAPIVMAFYGVLLVLLALYFLLVQRKVAAL